MSPFGVCVRLASALTAAGAVGLFSACATGEVSDDADGSDNGPGGGNDGGTGADGNVVASYDANAAADHAEAASGCTDPGCACTGTPATMACWTGPANQRNVGQCHDGTMACSGGTWGSCTGQVTDCGSGDGGGDSGSDGSSSTCFTLAGIGGIGVPVGSSATANASSMGYGPDQAIDKNAGSLWSAGTTTGTLTLTLPSAVAMTGVKIYTGSYPAGTVTYNVKAFAGGTQQATGSVSKAVSSAEPLDVALTPGSYDKLQFDGSTTSGSWVGIYELSLTTTSCP